ncbi:CaiB/BaiF CoA transferase family protein [Mycobacterium sp.]|uniref:CaiB/BaiF CoA transferase family protein n=1 Tax=Mycobacterium sp. TaxID=1785 RepID=UPI003F95CB50
MDVQLPLDGVVVVDLSSGVAGAYCTRVLADGGADVVKLESPDGDWLRRWSASGANLSENDGALFKFLAGGKRSVVIDAPDASQGRRATELLRSADIVVWSAGSAVAAAFPPVRVRTVAPQAVVVAITPFGLDGPWAQRPSTEFTLQAWCGGIAGRGDPARPPVSVGGRTGDWLTGMIAAVAALSARWRALRTGTGELVDLSALESMILTHTMYPVTYQSVTGTPTFAGRIKNFPGIERAKDGLVAFMVVTGQQWLDFCALVDKPDWADDESLMYFSHRIKQREAMAKDIDAWMGERTVNEIVELATLLRVPVAPVGNGRTVPMFDHFVEGGYFTTHPGDTFLQPTPPYRFHHSSAGTAPARPAPRLGEHNDFLQDRSLTARSAPIPADQGQDPTLPFAGMRVADFTAFWAGPIVGHVLGLLGADVIHVESVQRPDGMRFRANKPFDTPHWWETGPSYQGGNTNKRGLTLDMSSSEGRDAAHELIKSCDVVIENYTPRVTESWGLTYEKIRELKPDAIFVRMPAFGLSGPWRDRSGYAQTMEAVSGLAWLTGHPDEEPQFPNGPGDPVAGSHATIALLMALEHRRRTGEGALVESPMVGAALAIAAEQVVEYSAYGNLLEREGNRGPAAAPQNLYLAADEDDQGRRDSWVAIAAATEDQWTRLAHTVGHPEWFEDPRLGTRQGRKGAQDMLDAAITAWTSVRSADDIVETLWNAGVPVGKVIKAEDQEKIPQLRHRGFFEEVHHPLLGPIVHCGYPARFSAGPQRLNRSASPLLGEHNREILRDLCGYSDQFIAELEAKRVIGTEVTL